LGLQELPPRRPVTPRSGIQAGAFEDVAHSAGRHPPADPGEITADPLVTPARFSRAIRTTASRMSFLVEGRPGRARG
jgi:hypothetical protein